MIFEQVLVLFANRVRRSNVLSKDLFERIGTVVHVSFKYDRAGRSDGTAFVTLSDLQDARRAIREFDGANAKGQPITLTLMPSAPSRGGRRDNPFDKAEPPQRSLFDRVAPPRGRSASPGAGVGDEYSRQNSRRGGPRRGPPPRRSDVSKPAPENIDRYVPGQRNYSPRRGPREPGRRPGQMRENVRRDRDEGGHKLVGGRPRKTQEELDQEMDDYWGTAGGGESTGGNNNAVPAERTTKPETNGVAVADEGMGDIDMIE